jgi:hypothetical protein
MSFDEGGSSVEYQAKCFESFVGQQKAPLSHSVVGPRQYFLP